MTLRPGRSESNKLSIRGGYVAIRPWDAIPIAGCKSDIDRYGRSQIVNELAHAREPSRTQTKCQYSESGVLWKPVMVDAIPP